MDRKDSRYFPDKDKEAAFWPLKEPNKEEVEGDDLEILGFRDWFPPFPGICVVSFLAHSRKQQNLYENDAQKEAGRQPEVNEKQAVCRPQYIP